MAVVRDFVRKTPAEAPGPAHPCDASGLSPKDFLFSVMRDRTLPMSVRVKAATDLLPLTEPEPRPVAPEFTLKIVIEDIPPEALDGENRNQQSFSADRSYNHRPFMTSPGPSYIEKLLERMPLSEIISIVANCPEHLLPMCACGHRMFYPCSPPCTGSKPPLH
jgi:hypothetical protein